MTTEETTFCPNCGFQNTYKLTDLQKNCDCCDNMILMQSKETVKAYIQNQLITLQIYSVLTFIMAIVLFFLLTSFFNLIMGNFTTIFIDSFYCIIIGLVIGFTNIFFPDYWIESLIQAYSYESVAYQIFSFISPIVVFLVYIGWILQLITETYNDFRNNLIPKELKL